MQLGVVVQNNLNPMIAKRARRRASSRGRGRSSGARAAGSCPAIVGGLRARRASLYPFVIPWLIGDPEFADGALPFAILMAGVALASPYLPFNQMLLMAKQAGLATRCS